jgi:hypothetical protein
MGASETLNILYTNERQAVPGKEEKIETDTTRL